jgi:hypothetical protein
MEGKAASLVLLEGAVALATCILSLEDAEQMNSIRMA